MADAITGLMPIIQGIGTGTGVVGNLVSGIQRGQEVDALRNQQKILSNPAEVSKLVAGATQPLDQGLVQAVTNATQGAAAERGLATSPGLFSGMLAQNLAPFEQQNQSLALQQVLSQLQQAGLIGSTLLGGGYGSTNLSPALASLMKLFSNPAGTAPKTALNIPGYTDGGGIGDYGGGTGDYGGGGTIVDAPIDFGSSGINA